MVLPDHPTPIAKRTHTMDPVPFFIYNPEESAKGVDKFTEDSMFRHRAVYTARI